MSKLHSKVTAKVGKQTKNIQQNLSVNTSVGSHGITNAVIHGFTSQTNKQNDTSANTAGAVVISGTVGVRVFKMAQNAAPQVVNTASKMAKGTYRVVRIAESKILCVKSKIKFVMRKTAAHDMRWLKHDIKKFRVNTKLAIRNVRRFPKITIRKAVKTYKIVRGKLKTPVTVKLTKTQLKKISQTLLKNSQKLAWKSGKYAVKSAKSVLRTTKNLTAMSAKGTFKTLKTGGSAMGSALISSNDTGMQAVGIGIKTAEVGNHIGKMGLKTLKTSVKTGRKGIKLIRNARKTLKTLGVRKSAVKLAKHTVKAMINAAVQLVKNGLMKLALPAAIGFFVIAAVAAAASAPIAGIASIFSGVFSVFEPKDDGTAEYTDFETSTFLNNAVTLKRAEFAENIANLTDTNLVSGGGEYHFARLFKAEEPEIAVSEIKTGNNSEDIKIKTLGAIDNANQTADLLNPIFTVMLLQKYNLMPTQAQADETVAELWDTVMRTETTELPLEHCTDIPCKESGEWLADDDCPNVVTGRHNTLTCSVCDYEEEVSDGDDDGGTKTVFRCNGYRHCDGHRIIAIYIKQDGIYELLYKYFEQPAEELSNIENRTDEQNEQLQNLQDNLALCLDLINEVQGNTADGAGNTDLSGVEFINGERPGNQQMVDIAKDNIGNIGGAKFWRDLGYSSRIEWCAAFVSWCAKQNGYTPSAFSVFISCGAGISEFKNKGQWYAGNYAEPVAGDLIFFDWDNDGAADHVGLVAGHDGERVYTIEGNSGDVCRSRSYPITSSVIFGYGLPNY